MTWRHIARKIYWVLKAQFGVNPGLFLRSLRGIPRYISDYRRFRAGYIGPVEFLPCLSDWYAEGGATKGEYFWQDLLVARMIFAANPRRHVDVGSRVDGFVAHLASFREVDVFDVRPITTHVPGVVFRQADLSRQLECEAVYDSVSCLHALEHFGLGRYGDPVDPTAHERGLANLGKLLDAAGTLYLSVPIGSARVEFNGHRVFDPAALVELAAKCSLDPVALTVIQHGGRIEQLSVDASVLATLAGQRYALGIFVFRKRIGQ